MSEREDQVLWALLEIILVSMWWWWVGWLFGGVVFGCGDDDDVIDG